ncbi:carbohydrate ABC transporter permease [Arthrobacter dokdonensis]|uniref:carbohydrate ABC transporter permease n=1 Tax=Arthrobacter dokdonellae TaxID=2211210 RepID=UPI001D132265|nr:carbohydrate ABC transporter permease [Arthrobacter dokdonellae]
MTTTLQKSPERALPALGGRKRPKSSVRLSTIMLHLLLAVGGFLMVAPFLWMMLTSFKSLPQILSNPLGLFPNPWNFNNYADAWNAAPFGLAYWNSIYICVLTVAGTIVTASMAAYAFARIEFKGSKFLFVLFLATQMVPQQVTIVPLYMIFSKLGWVDTHLALIIPAVLCNPFAVFLVRQFIRSLPVELEEAARLDGAGRWRILFSIVMPNIKPGLAALSIVVALGAWNNFFLPLIVLNSENQFTVPLLLSQFTGQYGGVNYSVIMAASAISIVPMLIAFLIGNRRILNSMAMSGMGGS